MSNNLFVLFYGWLRARRIKKALYEDIEEDVCVACESRDLEIVGGDAYRCRACGYEGGQGWARVQREASAAKAATESPATRREKALRHLQEARLLLLAADGTMGGALSASRHDMLGLNSGGSLFQAEGTEKHSLVTNAMGDVAAAHGHLREAALRLKEGVPGAEGTPEGLDPELIAFDLFADGLIADFAVHTQLENLAGEIAGMLGATETALERLRGASKA